MDFWQICLFIDYVMLINMLFYLWDCCVEVLLHSKIRYSKASKWYSVGNWTYISFCEKNLSSKRIIQLWYNIV